MDAFFASVEQLTRPTLRGRPVLVGGSGSRGVVAGASYEARVFGARSAMPMVRARRLVGPAAVVLPPRGRLYSELSRRVFAVMRADIPVIEQLSLDEAFGEPVELVGADPDAVRGYAERLRGRILDQTGLTASIGAGSGKQLAKIASGMAKPDGIVVVDPAQQEQMLAALPVRKLWGIGPVAEERLRRIGVETIGQFAALDPPEVTALLGGAVGTALHRLARGLDERPVQERGDAKQISVETTYARDLTSAAQLRQALADLAGSALERLRADGRSARTVVVKLRLTDMSIITRSATLATPTTDRTVVVTTAHRLAPDPATIGAVRLAGIGLSGLTRAYQDALFPDLDPEPVITRLDEDDPAEAGVTGGTSTVPPPEHLPPATADTVGPTDTDTPAGTTADTATPAGAGTTDRAAGSDGAATPAGSAGAATPADTVTSSGTAEAVPESARSAGRAGWYPGADLTHPDHGFGWVQGSGHGVVTVRFETRSTGPGLTRTFPTDDPLLTAADPLDSLA